jgi:ABC-type branched-subunit amino acid transport system ATPase component
VGVLAGAVFAAKLAIVSPESFSFRQSFFVVAAVIIGGIAGAVAGGAVYILISEGLEVGHATLSAVIFSGAMLAMILLRPRGLLPAKAPLQPRRRRGAARGTARAPGGSKAQLAVGSGGVGTCEPGASGARLLVDDVVVRFEGLTAVAGVSLACEAGSVVALIGANGAGKTTLLNAISGLVSPAAGRVSLGYGDLIVDLTRRSAHRRAREGIGRTFQTPKLARELGVWENVQQGAFARAGLRGRRRAAGGSAVARLPDSDVGGWPEALAAVGLGDKADSTAGDLAYGDQRRCELARALVAGPLFVLMDEPSSGLNEAETEEMGQVVRSLAHDRGIGVLMVEHDMALVRQAADHVVAMDLGKVIAAGPPEDVLADPTVRLRYLGE